MNKFRLHRGGHEMTQPRSASGLTCYNFWVEQAGSPSKIDKLPRSFWLAIGAIASSAVFAVLIAPPLLVLIYESRIPLVGELVRLLGSSPAEVQERWNLVAGAGLALAAIWLLLAAAISRRGFVDRYIGSATPETLAAIRILVCSTLLIGIVWEDLASTALLPWSMQHPTWLLSVFYWLPIGFDEFVRNPEALWVFDLLTALLLLLGIVGWRTRVVLPLAALCCLIFGGIIRQYCWFYHTGLIPLYMLAALSFTPCADAWSLDRRRWATQGKGLPDPRSPAIIYGFSRYLCWGVIAIPYLEAGLSKLRNGGFSWWQADSMRRVLYHDSLNVMAFDWSLGLALRDAPDFVFAFLGITTIVVEIGYITVLFSPIARLILPLAMLAMHVGILFLQNIFFVDLILLQLLFVDFDALAARWRGTGADILPQDPASSSTPFGTKRKILLVGVASGLASLMMVSWLYRVQRYPLTAMQMYSRPSSSDTITYYKVLAHYQSGLVGKAPISDSIPAIAALDSRYRIVIRGAFLSDGTGWDERAVGACREFLQSVARAYNAKRSAGDPIRTLEVQQWTWNFLAYPQDPEHGVLANRFVVQTDSGATTREVFDSTVVQSKTTGRRSGPSQGKCWLLPVE